MVPVETSRPQQVPVPVVALIVAASSIVLYLGTAWFEFVYDDFYQVLGTPSIRSWHFWFYFTHPISGSPYYRPLFSLWFRLNYALFGAHPAGWHVTSILANSLAAALVYLIACRLAPNLSAAVIAAAVFVLHPVHIENVAWVSAVCDPLMAVFFCAAFLCYLSSRRPSRRRAWIAPALLLYALALLCKEPAVSFGIIVAAYAFFHMEGNHRQRTLAAIFDAGPFVLLLLPYFWIRRIALPVLAPVKNPMSWRTLLFTEPALLWFYCKDLFWPAKLALFHDVRLVADPSFANFVLPCLLLLAVGAAIALWARAAQQHGKLIWFAAAWMLITLLPALYIRSFPPEETVHDRYLYLPSIGFALLISLAAYQIFSTLRSRTGQKVAVGVVVAAGLVLCGLNLDQQAYWANDLALYGRSFAVSPGNTIAINNMARALTDHGGYAAAAPMFEEILRRNPRAWWADYNLGFADYKTGRYPDAEFHLRRALSGDEGNDLAHFYLGLTYLREGRLQDAEPEIRRALAQGGSRAGYHLALSLLLEAKGDRAGALKEAEAEFAAAPSEPVRQRIAALQKQP